MADWSIGTNSTGADTATPALFTSAASPAPSAPARTASAAAAIDAASVTSIVSGRSRSDLAVAIRSASCVLAHPCAQTENPSESRCSAVACPMPVDAPVTTA